jgi:hypothetical protein
LHDADLGGEGREVRHGGEGEEGVRRDGTSAGTDLLRMSGQAGAYGCAYQIWAKVTPWRSCPPP